MASGYVAQPIPSFAGGLNLRDKADAVGPTEAVDLLNVWFSERGAVRQRDGYTALTGSALTNAPDTLSPYYKTDGTKHILAGCGTRLEAVNTSGSVVASQTGLTTGTWAFARFGAPGSELAYTGNGKNLLYKWNGSAWASVANSPKARYLAVMAVDQGNRLVAGGFDDSATGGPSASQAYTSRVWFSNAGDPETYGANNYVDFTPGDGELIQGVIAWREFVVVFKESKFFVIYGTTTGADGNPIFNYRTVDAGIGLASPRALTAHRTGVYFMSRQGVYRTIGEEPDLLSDIIDPIWQGGASSYYLGGTLAQGNITNTAMGFCNERLYVAYTSGSTNDRMLVYDPRYKWWSLYDIPAACLTSFRPSSADELVFGHTSSKKIMRHSSAYTNDNGTAITSRWRSGWFDWDDPDIKTIRETKPWGNGSFYLGTSHDFETGTGALDFVNLVDASSDTWGGSTWGGGTWAQPKAETDALVRRAVRGTFFSLYVVNTTLDQTWSVSRVTQYLREKEISSKVTA